MINGALWLVLTGTVLTAIGFVLYFLPRPPK
jgi:hypothetical protein